MTKFLITLILIFQLHPGSHAQGRRDSVIYFNGFFRPAKEMEQIQYFGVPQKIKDQLYQVVFYTLDSVKMAMGEFKRKNVRRRNGVFVVYNSKGNIILTANYRRGTLNGVYQKFYDNGMLSDSGKINRGNLTGIWKSWYADGQLKEKRNYELARGLRGSQYSVLTKEYTSYYPSGNLNDSGYYRNNTRHGIWIEWIEGGTVRTVGEYKHGWKKGIWRFYDTKGKLLYMRRFNSLKYDDTGERIDIKQ